MYYIFDSSGECICSCDVPPDMMDLEERGETAIEDATAFDIMRICFVDGIIQEKVSLPNDPVETANTDPVVSNELMDIAEIILDMSDTIKALQKGGETS